MNFLLTIAGHDTSDRMLVAELGTSEQEHRCQC